MSWTSDYISDVRYPAFFYKEMQPLWLSTVAGLSGFTAPRANADFTLCELGCGVGINLLVAAACHPGAHFVGVDFNADHLTMARDAARSSGISNVEFIHADFAGFARDNLQNFDYITCHGVWSWIAAEQQAAVLDMVSAGLNQNGLFYLHYMCHPGSTDLMSFQHLLNLCAHHMPGPSPRKAQVGMKLLEQMAGSGIFADRPDLMRHLANMAKRQPEDIAHEFLTDHWRPQHCVDLHQQVAQAGLRYLASADVFNNLDPSLSIPGRMQGLIRQTQIPALAETMKDMARNAHQRMDLFQKEPTPLNRDHFAAHIARMQFRLLPNAPSHGPIQFDTPIGPITGPEAIFTPLLQRLAQGPASGADLLALPIFAGDVVALLQSLQLLMMQAMVHPATADGVMKGDQVERLAQWFRQNAIQIDMIENCGTAVVARP